MAVGGMNALGHRTCLVAAKIVLPCCGRANSASPNPSLNCGATSMRRKENRKGRKRGKREGKKAKKFWLRPWQCGVIDDDSFLSIPLSLATKWYSCISTTYFKNYYSQNCGNQLTLTLLYFNDFVVSVTCKHHIITTIYLRVTRQACAVARTFFRTIKYHVNDCNNFAARIFPTCSISLKTFCESCITFSGWNLFLFLFQT